MIFNCNKNSHFLGLRRRPLRTWELLTLGAILLLAVLLRFAGLTRNGIGSPYFAASVLSMSQDWKLFFYNSFDPGGFVTVDKPPLAYWMMALSARLFGFSSLSVLVPQALAGVATVAVLWHAIRRTHGPLAGLFAAFFLAIFPIAVAVDRSNMVDSWLTLLLTLAVSAASRERFVAAGAYVGLGFLTKLLAGLFVVPALFLAWILGKRRWGGLIAGATVLLAIGASWPLAVDLTPGDARPYVGGSKDNSVRDLIFGYNGLGRVLGRSDQTAPEMKLPPLIYGGTPGPGRLFEPRLGDGWAWVLPLSIIGAIVLARARRRAALALWAGWLLVVAALFSGARGTFHVHYLDALAPPTAALAGIGAAWAVRRIRRGGLSLVVGAVGVVFGVVWESVILARGSSPLWGRWLAPMLWLAGTVSVGWLLVLWLREARPTRWVGFFAVATLSIAPFAWSYVTTLPPTVSMAPVRRTQASRAARSAGNRRAVQQEIYRVSSRASGRREIFTCRGQRATGVELDPGNPSAGDVDWRLSQRRPDTHPREARRAGSLGSRPIRLARWRPSSAARGVRSFAGASRSAGAVADGKHRLSRQLLPAVGYEAGLRSARALNRCGDDPGHPACGNRDLDGHGVFPVELRGLSPPAVHGEPSFPG